MNSTEIKTNLKNILNRYNSLYKIYSEMNRKAFVESLSPGSVIPKKIPFMDPYKEDLNKEITKLQYESTRFLENAQEAISKAKTKAPDQNALNYIQMLSLNKDLNENDIITALDAYGHNYACYKAIKSLANDQNIRFLDLKDHELDIISDQLDSAKNSVNRFSVYQCENDPPTDGATTFQTMVLDAQISDGIDI